MKRSGIAFIIILIVAVLVIIFFTTQMNKLTEVKSDSGQIVHTTDKAVVDEAQNVVDSINEKMSQQYSQYNNME